MDIKCDWSPLLHKDTSRVEYPCGHAFVDVNGRVALNCILYGRLVCIGFSALGLVFAYLWSRDLYGRRAGLVAAAMYATEPNLLAHGELITPDSACVALGIASGYTFWRWLKQPAYGLAIQAGVVLGLAELTKMSWLFLFVLWPVLVAAFRYSRANRGFVNMGAHYRGLCLMFLTALYVMNCAYGFDGSFTKVGEFGFRSRLLTTDGMSGDRVNRFADTWCGNLHVPLPMQYVLGFDEQVHDLESFHIDNYLAGEISDHGWYHYYVYGLLVKCPWPNLVLGLIVLSLRMFPGRSAVRFVGELVPLSMALILLLMVSSQTEVNCHLRYAFPALALYVVLVAQLAALPLSRRLTMVACTMYASTVLSVAAVYPHQLAYFNEVAGGPYRGYKHLLGSSVDWGQDLLLLREYQERHDMRIVGFRGSYAHPAILRILFPPANWSESHKPGFVAISPNILLKERLPFPDDGIRVSPSIILVPERLEGASE
ncbi:MAG: glycosyltransferase family 39 protein [Planctomycetales bacterium]|nr:glycosyltransferase family 39 protein [Planctomycetales bacterium]